MKLLHKLPGNRIQCMLCPHYCKLGNEQTGICGVRRSNGSEIELITYGVISGYALDPIEKKPLYHFYPGHNILSIGSYGCNMHCDFCQNHNISQNIPENSERVILPEQIVRSALNYKNNIGIAFTYNEPVIWFEYMAEVAEAAKNSKLLTVMVSNGYVNKEPLDEIIKFIDAFNIDLKAFNNTFYKKLTGADLEPVKDGLKRISRSGKHLEITTLIIPGQNDDINEMKKQTEWIAGELGRNIPLHLSRYFPMFKRVDPSTSEATLNKMHEIASKSLDYVYTGNVSTGANQNTVCPNCNTIVTIRSGYKTSLMNIDENGRCKGCGKLIYSHLIFSSPEGH